MLSCSLLIAVVAGTSALSPADYFKITVVDQQTGRGIPLVELRTVHDVRCFTDSAGVVAFHEPGLMNTKVFFHLNSHGYAYPADGFGYRGARLEVTPGGSTTLKMRRINIAERLYRVTGAGIYRDSVLVGDTPPLRKPILNGQVLGSDSVVNTVYRDQIYWFWGDTNRPSYPLGNFHVPGATSRLPGRGGLDPAVGVDLNYFLDDEGFAKPTARLPGEGPTWIDGLVTVPDRDGHERLFAAYVKIQPPLEVYARGLAEFDDEQQKFVHRLTIPLDAPLYPTGHPTRFTEHGTDYLLFGHPFPAIRVRATAADLLDLSCYEALTCLSPGGREKDANLVRDAGGTLSYGWKPDTVPLDENLRTRLIREKRLQPDEGLVCLQDVTTGKRVFGHGGSVYWNAFRQRWIMIVLQSAGTSFLGEIWYAESDTPFGPWVYARKIVTHEKYSFYNPKQHPMFDQDGGRTIFFEGTYTHTFSGNSDCTPRYDYNQVMYRLDLTDPRLALPVPVYRQTLAPRSGGEQPFPGDAAGDSQALRQQIGWLALDRPVADTIPVFANRNEAGAILLSIRDPSSARSTAQPAFHAIPADAASPPVTTVPLFEFTCENHTHRLYSTAETVNPPGYQRSARPLCRVWPAPR